MLHQNCAKYARPARFKLVGSKDFSRGSDRSCRPEKLGGPRRNSTKRLGSGIGCGTKSRRSCADLPEKNCITWLSKGKSHLVKFVQGRAICISGENVALVAMAGKCAMVALHLH